MLLERGQLAAAEGNLTAIADLTERMGKITSQLKLFAGKARPVRRPVALRAAVDGSARSAAAVAPRKRAQACDMAQRHTPWYAG